MRRARHETKGSRRPSAAAPRRTAQRRRGRRPSLEPRPGVGDPRRVSGRLSAGVALEVAREVTGPLADFAELSGSAPELDRGADPDLEMVRDVRHLNEPHGVVDDGLLAVLTPDACRR